MVAVDEINLEDVFIVRKAAKGATVSEAKLAPERPEGKMRGALGSIGPPPPASARLLEAEESEAEPEACAGSEALKAREGSGASRAVRYGAPMREA